MEGPLGVVDPDFVEQETGNFWRSLYKSEKQFNEVPTAQKIAKKVSLLIHLRSTESLRLPLMICKSCLEETGERNRMI